MHRFRLPERGRRQIDPHSTGRLVAALPARHPRRGGGLRLPAALHPQTFEPRQGCRAIFGDLRQTPRFTRREQRGETLSYSLLQTFRGDVGMAEMGRRRRRTIRCRAVRPSGNGGQ